MELLTAVQALVSISSEASEQGVLERTVTLARLLTGARYGAALLTGPDGAPSALAHQGMTDGHVAALPHLPRPLGLLGVVLTGVVTRIDRIADHPASIGFPSPYVPMAALLGVPLISDGRVLGGLYLTRPPEDGIFSDTHEALVLALARQAAVAVDALRRLSAAPIVLGALGLTSNRAGDLPRSGADPASSPVAQRLLAAARQTLGMDLSFLSRLDGGTQTFTHVDRTPTGPALPAGLRVDASEGYCQLMLDGQIPASVPDVAAHPLLAGMAVTADLSVGAYCGVPVHLPDGTLYGTLCGLHGSAQAAPSSSQLESLRTIAGLLGASLDQDRCDDQARQDRAREFLPLLDGPGRSLVLQPIVDLTSRTTVGFEALSRFADPAGAPRRADQVFAQAAGLGLGVRLEQAAARDALALLPQLPPGTYLSVNLSPAALLDPGTYDLLTASIPLHRVVIELTEHEQIADYPALLAALAGLRSRGLRLAVDDAGAGFASLQHITRLAPDIIKLDIAFVRHVDVDPSRRAVARAMTAFATELDATLVAEGIETAAELNQLHALGVHLGQGYHLGRPAAPRHHLHRPDQNQNHRPPGQTLVGDPYRMCR